MLVSAVVVNLDQREKLLECLRSLVLALDAVEGPTEVTIVDNGSCDDSVAAVHESLPQVNVIEAGRNLGFPRAAMAGVRETSGEWVLMLNNDATLDRDAVVELLRAADGRPDVGSVAAQLRFADGTGRINSAGFGIDRLGIAYELGLGRMPSPDESEPTEVFGASGGASIFRRAMLEDVGGYDESFFVFLEDADLAWRARNRGWRALCAPRAVGHHHHSLTAKHGSRFKYFHVGLNRVRVLAKNAPASHLRRYGAAIVAYDLAYVLFALIADRTVAPIQGRLRGLREWRRYRPDPAPTSSVALEPIRGLRAALARHRAWLDARGS
jgi:GT2 family glycosyltransferase